MKFAYLEEMKSKYLSFLAVIFALGLSCSKDDGPEIPEITTNDRGPEGSTLPYFVISSGANEIVDEPKVPGSMAVFVEQQQVFTSPIGVELRGSTSRRLFPKQSYSVETWDENGQDRSVTILDYALEEDWVLQGPYSDKTLLRNVLIYDLSNDIGRYAVKTDFVELNLNEDYKGVYVFSEKIKRDRTRVNLLSLEPNQTDSEVISGGYILKIDKTSGDTDNPDWPGDSDYSEALGFRSDYAPDGNRLDYEPYGEKRGEETYFLYEYPDATRINSAQKSYIQNYISELEEALLSEDYSGPREYEEYIDVQSFVDFFILNELAANPDSYRLSTYMHKDRNGKLKMGPIWDFNLGFGNDGRSQTDSWIYQYNETNPGDLWLIHFWWDRLMADPQFRSAIKARWNDLKGAELSLATINAKINTWTDLLEQNGALDRNYTRWDVMGEPLPFNSFVGDSYEDEIAYVKRWIADRIVWMDGQIQGW